MSGIISVSRLAAACLVVTGLAAPSAASAQEPVAVSSSAAHRQILNRETGEGKSYSIPALEIPSFLIALNMYDRWKYGNATYGTDLDTFWHNFSRENWAYDKDTFRMNELWHPYQGSTMYGLARSAGLSFWQSLLYSDAGSLLWKWGGETGQPSINDMITTGQAGSVLGEPLFRMANLTLEGGGDEPGFWRELGAAAISPPLGLNRLLFGDRFKAIYPAHGPATFTYLQFMGSLEKHSNGQGASKILDRKQMGAAFHMAYGLPGKDGYKYTRPFDYFSFEFSPQSGRENLDSILVRGLLTGEKYESGEDFRGVWGLYGSYDYISPTVFRVANTSASLGTTGQWWLSKNTALQGTLLAGPGYGGGGVAPKQGDRNYHIGATAQGLAALRFIVDKKMMLDGNARTYYITDMGANNTRTAERISRFDIGLVVRVHGPHAVGIQYVESRRHSDFPLANSSHQRVTIASLSYTLAFDPHFGAVEWRDGMDSGNR